jgi:hypothetical protein
MEEHTVIADDGRVLWATESGHAESGHAEPLVLCHGGPGLWHMFDGLAELPADRVRVIRDFADPATARQRAEEPATPWFGVNEEANAALNAETRTRDERELVARCRGLDVPTAVRG